MGLYSSSRSTRLLVLQILFGDLVIPLRYYGLESGRLDSVLDREKPVALRTQGQTDE